MSATRRPLLVGLACLLLTACQAAGREPGDLPTQTLQPYRSAAATATRGPRAGTSEPIGTPAPTATPLTHLVTSGETLLGIASQYGVSLDALLLANPGIDPRILSIGQALLIPGPEGQPVSALAPTPTPIPLDFSTPDCHPSPAGALWCLILVHNPGDTAVEGIVGLVTLFDEQGAALASVTAVTPLNLLPPEGELPLAAYFPAQLRAPATAEITPLSALQVGGVSERYLPLSVAITRQERSPDLRQWQVAGTLHLADDADAVAGRLVVAAVAYGTQGELVGFTVRELPAGLEPGAQASFDLSVYGFGAEIERVEVLAEAQPAAEAET